MTFPLTMCWLVLLLTHAVDDAALTAIAAAIAGYGLLTGWRLRRGGPRRSLR